MPEPEHSYVSRGGVKLEAALRAFRADVSGRVCCDFGSHAGGFVDCLLRHGAARVYAVEPGYGVLDYRLRKDPRVVVRERTNALRFEPPEPCALVTIDAGWTPQRVILPAARRCLRPAGGRAEPATAESGAGPTAESGAVGRVITLVKPHYEAPRAWLRGGVLPDEHMDAVLKACREDVHQGGWRILAELESPIRGHAGNREFLWLLAPGGDERYE